MKSLRTVLPLLIFATLTSLSTVAQDKIIMTTGSIITAKVISADDVFVEYEIIRNNGKKRRLNVSRYEVFSIQYADGTEVIIYQQDFFEENGFTEEAMRTYIAGERDAIQNYHPKATFWTGVGLGLAGGYLGESSILWTMAPPILWGAGQYMFTIRIREETMSDLGNKFDNNYALGYERVARSRKILSGLKGGALGSAVGLGIFLLTDKEN